MFSIKENDCVGFDSKWKVKRVFTEGTSQTSEFSICEAGTNTATSVTIETQTDDDVVAPTKVPKVNMERLADWLTKIFPTVQRELTEANNSKAFNGSYSLEESESPDAKLLQTLKVSGGNKDGESAVRVCALSWNSTGNTLAVSCSHYHRTWCPHSGQVNFYTFDRNDKLPDVPLKKLTTSACVSSLRFHPAIPSVIACGTYSGEIIIWNIQHDDGDNTVVKLNAHEEGITDIAWIHNIDPAKTLLLATASLDGCLNLWNFSLPFSALVIVLRYKIKAPAFGKFQRPGLAEEIAKKTIRGILSFDFSTYVPDMFVVGVEGGLVIQCSMLGTNPMKGSTKEIPIADPVFKYYEPHNGEINTARFSPNRRDMFMTNASDGEIRIYVIGQDAPSRIIFAQKQLNQVTWVPYQEKLIVGCGEHGFLDIFHLISGDPIPDITSEKVVSTMLLQLEVNKQRCSIVAVGNDRGEILLWSMPWGLFALQKV